MSYRTVDCCTGLDIVPSRVYFLRMTKLLEKALVAVRGLDPEAQDEIACAMMALAGSDDGTNVSLTPAERAAVSASRAAAERGDFATDQDVQRLWAKHGL